MQGKRNFLPRKKSEFVSRIMVNVSGTEIHANEMVAIPVKSLLG